jgi:hypothetical protein
MSQYLLSTWSVEDESPGEPPTPEQMQEFMQRVIDLEAEMDSSGTFLFGGGLHGPDAATIVRATEGDAIVTDGPFAESKEHIAGFYVIDADDLDEALDWANKVSAAIGRPIEVRPFRATGRVADQMAGE